ncbi:LuxR C-terminal-related transcriptional regulator [Planotetraspora kaengkrachanensis]|uniref:LuxR family transcriptional regulator n=1 Tax=Planotetraspora kaengkrachanensis TaxID=575193 RepID=A0A8J3VCG8_9ACTN|nr:LuxR C-terminal-related transcriptional regulator [Planotetraspora kaengkrachanensis]GIG84479.1 LuxR family transcriptional regulator [Planotetraspora kaengkrachanensis]
MATMARPPRPSGNLPAEVTSFIGRRRELAEVRKKLTQARLVSLIGPGGVGKTRLALRMATDLGRGFPGGAWLVELAEVRDPARVGDVVTAALDLRDQAATEPLAHLRAYLRDKKLLLVMDNCEHLLEAAARLMTEIMRAAPSVRVIATSREPLSVPGEHVVPVPPLELPSAHAAASLARLRENEAVMLFAERAAAGSGRFQLTAANQAAVVDLCRRLDGLPLAIELAAVRTRVLTVEQILDRLTDRFGLLTGGGRAALPRHQTLRTTIDWSHDLLAAGEQTLLRRLCVFAGRFTLEDIESVCTSDDVPPTRALDVLTSLVDKSLVMKEDAKSLACYRLHETMREYAGLKLREAGEEESIQRRCAEYYRSRCQRSAAEARYRLAEWLEWMDLEIDNVRSVLRRCLTHKDFPGGIALAHSLGWYWMTRATSEGIRWFDELLADGDGNPRAHAQAYFMRGFLAVLQSDPSAARPALERAVTAAEEAGQLSLLSQSLSLASIAANMAGDRTRTRRLVDDAQAVTTGLDDLPATLMLLQSRALNGLFDGDLDAVRSASSEGARLSREAGDLYSLGMMLMNLGFATLIAGDLDESKPLFAEALRIAHRIDDRVAQYCLLDALGCHAASSGHTRLAARLLGAAETVRKGVGASVMSFLAPLLTQAEESVTATLGAPEFEAEYKAGKRLSRDAAVGLALGEPAHAAAAASDDAAAAPLGKREAEVARLVADGLSNKQIGARLFISEHTVDSHVRNILNKLGFNSRTQIAVWTASSNQ